MKKILIAYATTEGQTAKVSAHLKELAVEQGFACEVMHVDQVPEDFNLDAYDQAVLAASVHEGQYQKTMREFAKQHAGWLNAHNSPLFSVSLSAADMTEEAKKDLRGVVKRFSEQTGFDAEVCAHVAGALKYTQYSWLKRLVMKQISKARDGEVDTSQDFEYTEWKRVGEQAEALIFTPLT